MTLLSHKGFFASLIFLVFMNCVTWSCLVGVAGSILRCSGPSFFSQDAVTWNEMVLMSLKKNTILRLSKFLCTMCWETSLLVSLLLSYSVCTDLG